MNDFLFDGMHIHDWRHGFGRMHDHKNPRQCGFTQKWRELNASAVECSLQNLLKLDAKFGVVTIAWNVNQACIKTSEDVWTHKNARSLSIPQPKNTEGDI